MIGDKIERLRQISECYRHLSIDHFPNPDLSYLARGCWEALDKVERLQARPQGSCWCEVHQSFHDWAEVQRLRAENGELRQTNLLLNEAIKNSADYGGNKAKLAKAVAALEMADTHISRHLSYNDPPELRTAVREIRQTLKEIRGND